jgi:hypothetical protein
MTSCAAPEVQATQEIGLSGTMAADPSITTE